MAAETSGRAPERRTSEVGERPLAAPGARARMTRDPRGFRATACAAAASRRVLGGRDWVGLMSLAIAVQFPGTTNTGRSIEAAATKLLAGSALIGAGLYVSFGQRRPTSGALFGLAALAWSLEEWNNPATGVGAAFTLGLVGYAIAPAFVAHAVLAYPFGRLGSRLERLTIVVAYVDTVLVLGLVSALFFAPAAHQCHLCPPNLLLVRDNPELYDGLQRLGRWLLVGWTAAFVALAIRRLLRPSGPIRRLTAPVLVVGSAYVLLVLAAAAQSVASGVVGTGSLPPWLWFAQAAALCAIGLAVAWSWSLRRRTRSLMAGLVVELGKTPPPGGLQEMLGRILGDPALRVAYAVEGRDELVDANGNVVDVAEGLRRHRSLARAERSPCFFIAVVSSTTRPSSRRWPQQRVSPSTMSDFMRKSWLGSRTFARREPKSSQRTRPISVDSNETCTTARSNVCSACRLRSASPGPGEGGCRLHDPHLHRRRRGAPAGRDRRAPRGCPRHLPGRAVERRTGRGGRRASGAHLDPDQSHESAGRSIARLGRVGCVLPHRRDHRPRRCQRRRDEGRGRCQTCRRRARDHCRRGRRAVGRHRARAQVYRSRRPDRRARRTVARRSRPACPAHGRAEIPCVS